MAEDKGKAKVSSKNTTAKKKTVAKKKAPAKKKNTAKPKTNSAGSTPKSGTEYLVRLEIITSTGSKDAPMWEKGVGVDDVAASKAAIKKLKLRKGWKAEYTKQFKELKK